VTVLQSGDVLVGHSGGGYDITLAADATPALVRHLVYLAAGLPLEGRTVLEATGGATNGQGDGEAQVTQLMTDQTGMLRFIRPDDRGRMECIDFEDVWAFFYHDCDEETAKWAFERLTPAPVEFLMEKVSVPNFWQADLSRSYVRCLQDRAKPHAMSVEVADRLGVSALAIDASHSPFLSRPAEVAELLVQATTTTPVSTIGPD
jgi:pimeloyl-ACP methyl ester carboxylesterase